MTMCYTSNYSDISFPQYAEVLPDQECLSFSAMVDGQWVVCFLSLEGLRSRYGGIPGNEMSIFQTHRNDIEDVARGLIQRGRVSGGRLVIGPYDLGW